MEKELDEYGVESSIQFLRLIESCHATIDYFSRQSGRFWWGAQLTDPLRQNRLYCNALPWLHPKSA